MTVGRSGPAVTRVGFVGAGAVARRHLDTLRGFGDVDVAGVADPDEGRAREFARACGARVYPGPEALVAAGVDAVYICVPPYAHGPAELAAIEARVPFFVEKPLAADLRTAEAIAARVAETGLVTATGYHWRYLEIVRIARELLAGRTVGLVHCYWLDRVAPPWWWVDRGLSGGQVVEQATHVLDLARLLVDEVEQVYAAATRRPCRVTRVDDATAATLRFASGAIGTLASTCLLPRKHRAGLQVFADGLALDISESELVVRTGEGLWCLPANQPEAKARADRAFIDAVRRGPADIRAPYAEALRTHRLGCAIAASVTEGRPVTLREKP